ncbi:hypothetical protein CWI38_2130p0010 [Hamiltosporidium tvaerminnensis]|uniref:Uncharacterized protein n=1 Tax=Hamiltosporidium tvaerminnensis TaxID=1176355 RepID=A0A4Q9LQ38_9MICR|nr:hypothetical protein CWI38_2130p0010 [Hamiltosporidium tvaerminnensis]
MCQHCNQSRKTVDHLATRCEKMLGHDYTRRHKEVSQLVQEILDNKYAEIRVNTRIKTDVKIRCNRPDIFILDKRQNRITLIETVKTISFDRRRGIESGPNAEESWERASLIDNEENDVKIENTKNILHLILDGIITAKKPSTNTNEELKLEEEIEVIEMVERII